MSEPTRDAAGIARRPWAVIHANEYGWMVIGANDRRVIAFVHDERDARHIAEVVNAAAPPEVDPDAPGDPYLWESGT